MVQVSNRAYNSRKFALSAKIDKMTNLPPSGPERYRDPLDPAPGRQPSRRDSFGFNELVGVIVAFGTIGTILFWSLTREQGASDLGNLFPFAAESPLPSPLASDPLAPTSPSTTEVEPERVGPERVGPQQVGPRVVGPERVGQRVRSGGFSDVTDDYWAYPFIAALSQRQIISGFQDGTFRPDQPVTRAEFASFVQKAFDQNLDQKAVQYNDIPSDFWAAPAIQAATRTGFLKGYPGNVFRPKQQISKVQALVALGSGLGLAKQSSANQNLPTFQDANQVPGWATDKVAAATRAGLVVNYPQPNLLKPKEYTTRADAAALIYQALVQAKKAEPIDSEYVIRP